MGSGYSGVTVFFVLSGFVLAINYFEAMRQPRPKGVYDYFVARFARVYPLYALLLLYAVVQQHQLGLDIDGWWRNALVVQAWDPNLAHAYSFDPPAWSISVEFFLYACFPLLIPLVARLRGASAVLATAAGVAVAMLALTAWFAIEGRGDLPPIDPGSAHRWLYRTPLTRLGDFALGILAARFFVETRDRGSIVPLARKLTWVAGALIIALMAWPSFFFSVWSFDVAYAIPAAVLVFGLAAAPLSLPARALSLPFLILLGEASYAFYLAHSPAIELLGAGQWSIAVSFGAVAYEALALGAVLALAVGLHVTVERPARVFLRKTFSRTRASKRRAEQLPP